MYIGIGSGNFGTPNPIALFYMGLFLAKYDKLKSFFFCPRLHRIWEKQSYLLFLIRRSRRVSLKVRRATDASGKS